MKGQEAEDRALQHLLQAGHVLLQRNFRVRGGELDLITRDGPVVVFTEVRHRSKVSHGHPLETIGPVKASRMWRTALVFLQRDDVLCRFDAITITGDALQGELLHISNILQEQ